MRTWYSCKNNNRWKQNAKNGKKLDTTEDHSLEEEEELDGIRDCVTKRNGLCTYTCTYISKLLHVLVLATVSVIYRGNTCICSSLKLVEYTGKTVKMI